MLSPTCTDAIPHSTEQPPQYWCYSSTILMLSPHMYWCYPPTCTDAIPPHVLMLSPPHVLQLSSAVLNSLHSTDAIPLQYWTASAVLMLLLHSIDAILPQYWCYSSTVLMLFLYNTDAIPLQYWCYSPTVLTLSPTVLMLSPTVLNNLHSTDVIPHMYWCYPPQWTASAVLNRRYTGWPLQINFLKFSLEHLDKIWNKRASTLRRIIFILFFSAEERNAQLYFMSLNVLGIVGAFTRNSFSCCVQFSMGKTGIADEVDLSIPQFSPWIVHLFSLRMNTTYSGRIWTSFLNFRRQRSMLVVSSSMQNS